MRLLVVEDNAQLSQLLAKGLQTAGYDTDLLATAAEARAPDDDFLRGFDTRSGTTRR